MKDYPSNKILPKSTYSPLDHTRDEIRVLVLFAGCHDDPIRGKLITVSLPSTKETLSASQISYETISYCWGSVSAPQTIEINDLTLNVQSSAIDVLRRVRLDDQSRTVWIDSVCINQDDVDERGQQVTLMYKVYAMGKRNLVWLGQGDDTTAVAIEGLKELHRVMRDRTNNYETFWVLYVASNRLHVSTVDSQIPSTVDCLAVLRLMSSAVFSRLWVVQELALAADNICFCGPYEVPVSWILRAAVFLNFLQSSEVEHGIPPQDVAATQYPSILFMIIDELSQAYRHVKQERLLWTLLFQRRRFRATNPRDHVYGCIGQYRALRGEPKLSELLHPDYNQPVWRVYTDATRLCIEETQSFDIFAYMFRLPHWQSQEITLPSWVVAWNVADETPVFDFSLIHSLAARAHNGVPLSVMSLRDELWTLGIPLDEVKGITQPCPYSVGGWAAFVCAAKKLLFEDDRVANAYSPDGIRKTLRTTLMTDIVADSNDQGENPVDSEDTLSALLLAEIGRAQAMLTPSIQTYRSMLVSAHRRFFITADGTPGLGPRGMITGDKVVILYGCKWPCILRGPDVDDTYSLVGLSYVHGIMLGEGVRTHKVMGGEDVTFRLR